MSVLSEEIQLREHRTVSPVLHTGPDLTCTYLWREAMDLLSVPFAYSGYSWVGGGSFEKQQRSL